MKGEKKQMKNRMILILGRTGAGKDTVAHLMAKAGLRQLKSYATRPKRSENEDTHTFIAQGTAGDYPDKVAYTKIGEFEYFATRKQLEDCDIYVIDPTGLYELEQKCPDMKFDVLYVCKDTALRQAHAAMRGDSATELAAFDKRQEAENGQFTQFEDLLCSDRADSIGRHIALRNNGTMSELETNVTDILIKWGYLTEMEVG